LFFLGSKKVRFFLSFLFSYHTFHGQKKAMYDYVTFLFPFTDEWLERSGWMGWNGSWARRVLFDRVGDEIEWDL
jgi:hypothetical protein